MFTVLSYYFSTLFSRFFVLLFCCSFIPLFLLAFNYSSSVAMSIFKDILLLSLPWFLWFHQAWFTAFVIPKKIIDRCFLIITSTVLSALILIVCFPYTQRNFVLSLDQIVPNIVAPNYDVIPTKQGTLILDPQKNGNIFAKSNTVALWVDSNFLLFNSLETNKDSFLLKKPETFSSFGYYPQKGEMSVLFNSSYPSFPQYILGQYIVQTWYDNMMLLNREIYKFYSMVKIPITITTNNQVHNIRLTNNNVKLTNNINLKDTKIVKKHISYELYIAYVNIFISLICIFSFASLIGILVTIGQTLLGSVSLLLILSLYAPVFSISIMNLSLRVNFLYPSYSLILINSILILLLYCSYLIATSIKNISQGVRY